MFAECGIAMYGFGDEALFAYTAQGPEHDLCPPVNLREALAREQESNHWHAACIEELASLKAKGVFTLTDLPAGTKAIPSMWVFAYKVSPGGAIERYKARLVAKGFAQKPGRDYRETWAPTGSLSVLRCLFGLAAAYDYDIVQADIKTAFLNGPLHEPIYMCQPPGFGNDTHQVWFLHKAMYGLKQGARAWYLELRSFLSKIGFVELAADPATFVKIYQTSRVFIYTHVDDILLFAPRGHWQDIHEVLNEFEGKLFGEASFFLGMRIERDRKVGTISVSQRGQIQGVLLRTGMAAARGGASPLPPGRVSKPATTPTLTDEEMSLYPAIVGSILYISTVTRPDVAFAASSLARHLSKPIREQLDAAYVCLRCLKTTENCKLVFGARRHAKAEGVYNLPAHKHLKVLAYGDEDFANCDETRRSVTGIVITLDGTPVVWASRKQPTVTKSTTAAEYVAQSMTADEAIRVQKVLQDMNIPQPTIPLLCDNTAAQCLLRNPVEAGRTKYLEIHWHFVRELIRSGRLVVCRVDTGYQVADVKSQCLSVDQQAGVPRQ